MKKILFILILLGAISVQAADRITASISFTNTPADGNTITVNGDVRTWKTTIVTPASQIAVTNNAANSATNYFNQIIAYQYSSPLAVAYVNATNIQLAGNSGNTLIVTASGTYASITYSTQSVAQAAPIRASYASASDIERTNSASAIVDFLNSDKSTNIVSDSSVTMGGFATLSTIQTIAGKKTFINNGNVFQGDSQVFNGGTITNVTLTNSTYSGNIGKLTNGALIGTWITNGGLYGTILNDDNGGANYLKIINSGEDEFNFRRWGADKDGNTIVRFTDHDTNTFTYDAGGANTIGVKIKPNAILTGFTSSGTNRFLSQVEYARKDNSGLANGNNAAVDVSTNVYVKVSGPTAAFTINGIAGGTDGRVVVIQSSLGYDVTVANSSGVDPTAANRILTRTGADVAVTGAGVIMLRFRYDSSVSRWIYEGSN